MFRSLLYCISLSKSQKTRDDIETFFYKCCLVAMPLVLFKFCSRCAVSECLSSAGTRGEMKTGVAFPLVKNVTAESKRTIGETVAGRSRLGAEFETGTESKACVALAVLIKFTPYYSSLLLLLLTNKSQSN